MDADGDEVRARLDREMDRRRLELHLRWNQVAERAGMTYGNLHKIRKGQTALTEFAKSGLERALDWPRGHIDQSIESWTGVAGQPLTPEQRQLVDIYRALKQQYGAKEAQRRVIELMERLNEDERAVKAAIDQEPELSE